ncbi:adenylosuccinate synthase [bacterium]|nr:adenylosuccinate synthase [bacterium]
MTVTAIIGAQWGDEGKGKLTHLLSADHDIVLRYQGGANAGHTIKDGDKTYRCRLVPSGVLREGVRGLLCDGVVVNPVSLAEELAELRTAGGLRGSLQISRHAHLVLPYHGLQDAFFEQAKGGGALGTTLRGIGPAYADKYFRVGLRAGDMLRPDFGERMKQAARRKNVLFSGYYGQAEEDPDAMWEKVQPAVEQLAPLVADTLALVRTAIRQRERILCEGAQGTLLDIDYGTYPYVTSSHPVSGGAFTGTGINWRDMNSVIGVAKAYCTRVGAGPFPTELPDEIGDMLRERGGEFGTVTGRSRRCGWLDLPLLRYSAELNGFTELALTKVDVLDELDEIPVCVAWEINGQKTEWPDLDIEALEQARPVYKRLPGWQANTCGHRGMADLPQRLKDYVRFIEDFVGVPVRMISVGAETGATVVGA